MSESKFKLVGLGYLYHRFHSITILYSSPTPSLLPSHLLLPAEQMKSSLHQCIHSFDHHDHVI